MWTTRKPRPFSLFLSVFLTFCTLDPTSGYKPVIYMHGILASGHKEGNPFTDMVVQSHPGTNVTVIDAFNDASSLESIAKQVVKIIPLMQEVMKASKDGVHLVCFSQGGVICRAVLQMMPDHNVHNFIALSSPLAGQFGLTKYIKPYLPRLAKEDIYKFFYSEFGQEISVANYWNDPHHQDQFRDPRIGVFLAVLNNQTTNPNSHKYKDNFLRIKNLVAVSGPNDGVITPWQSSHFGMFDSSEKVLDVRQQEWYVKDSFGLKTLDKRGGFHIYQVPGVDHHHWYKNQTVFDKCISQWLT